MKVMKFGGTSVGSPERMRDVAALITRSGEKAFVVLSAMSGTTNLLVEICGFLYRKDVPRAEELIGVLSERYHTHVQKLYESETWKMRTTAFIDKTFDYLRSFTTDIFTGYEERCILAQGELISTTMLANLLAERGVKARLLPALDFMRTDKYGEPDQPCIKEKLTTLLAANDDCQIYITQGFICRNAFGEVDNLGRGGSDYTASLIGAALDSGEVQIWTDIDGMHNNDPRIVENTSPVRRLSYEEAAELAFFGAKILHPTCIEPARDCGVPVRLLNTMEPDAEGTLISGESCQGGIKAIAAKDSITAITIHASKGVLVSSFQKHVFDAFEHYQTAIDVAGTSQANTIIAFTDNRHTDDIVEEIESVGVVEVESDCCIVCVVGDILCQGVSHGSTILNALKGIPVKMVSLGASKYSLSLLISMKYKKEVLQRLSDAIL